MLKVIFRRGEKEEKEPAHMSANDIRIFKYRQFITKIECTSGKLKSLIFLSECINLRVLILNRNMLKSLEGLYNCTHLKGLICENNPVETLDGLEKCRKLRVLVIRKTQISSLRKLRELPYLRHLDCSYTKIHSIDDILPCSTLRYLNCAHTEVYSLKILTMLNLTKLDCDDKFRRIRNLINRYKHMSSLKKLLILTDDNMYTDSNGKNMWWWLFTNFFGRIDCFLSKVDQ